MIRLASFPGVIVGAGQQIQICIKLKIEPVSLYLSSKNEVSKLCCRSMMQSFCILLLEYCHWGHGCDRSNEREAKLQLVCFLLNWGWQWIWGNDEDGPVPQKKLVPGGLSTNCHRMLPGCWETEKEKGKGYDLSGQTGRIGQKKSSYLAACSSRFPSVASVSSNSEAQIFFVPYKLKSHEIKRFNCR